MNDCAGTVPEETLRRFDLCSSRYPCFPTVDRFVEAFTADDYARALTQRRSGVAARSQPLAMYVHIPFCQAVCFFCACDKIITRQHDRGAPYVRYLGREVDLHIQRIGVGQTINQLHLGGGTPTFLSDAELGELMAILRRSFVLAPGGEYSIEIDPRTVDCARLDVLARLGFKRLSFGVQDFDRAVQKAVRRTQSPEQTASLVEAARARGFESINLDLIYGLPRQSPASFDRTLALVTQLRPDRVALYPYLHLPQRFEAQRRIACDELPDVEARAVMLSRSTAALCAAGYVHVGMDHFALASDPLAVAKRQGRLHRNFQGYSTQPDCDLISLGLAAVGHVGATYSQNAKTMAQYGGFLDQDRFPVARGLVLSRDDMVRRAVIMALMCQGAVQFESIELAFFVTFQSYFARELVELETLVDLGWVIVDANGIQVTLQGRYRVHVVAMVFDRYLQNDRAGARFSNIP